MTLKLGFGKKALPSPVGTELCGYGYFINRVCTEVLDTLHVRCIALSSGDVKSLVLSADLIGLSAQLHEEIRRLIADKLGYAGKEVMVVCTHTHTGPSTYYLAGGGAMNDEYNRQVPPVFLAAAEAAVADLTPCEGMEECCQSVEEIAYNRNIPDGPHDNMMRGLVVKRSGKASVAIVSYPCHPVTLGPRPQASADYPGAVCRKCEARGLEAIFLTGACGDINPLINRIKWGSGTPETVEQYTKVLFKGFFDGLHKTDDIDLDNMEFDATVKLRSLDEKEIDEIVKLGSFEVVAKAWGYSMLRRLPIKDDHVMVRAIKIGPMVFCSFPFETFTIVGNIVRETYPGKNIVVLGCADQMHSYLPIITPELQNSYPVIAAAQAYAYPVIAVGAAEYVAKQIADGIARWETVG